MKSMRTNKIIKMMIIMIHITLSNRNLLIILKWTTKLKNQLSRFKIMKAFNLMIVECFLLKKQRIDLRKTRNFMHMKIINKIMFL